MAKPEAALDVHDPSERCPAILEPHHLSAAEASELARGFWALADPLRLRVLSMLASASAGEVCVYDFVSPLGKAQPTVSHQLEILSEAWLVHGAGRRKWVWHSLARARLASLRHALEA